MNTATAARLADIYARSLLDLTKESRTVDAIAADLEAVSTLLAQQPGLEAFLASPYFAEQTKRDLIREVLTGRLQPLTVNFLSVLIDHNRGAILPKVLERFRQLYRAYQGYETIAVTVAQSLSQEQLQKLSRELAEAMRAKIDLEVLVDPSILGGVIIRHSDKMLDNSVRGRLVRTVGRIANPENRFKR
ncbi:MAG: ATP synthase F1 subunit delta [Phycisphaerae bacterium]|nr:ATP synthase F1 subunit delta [Phycisphaerae bacterium]